MKLKNKIVILIMSLSLIFVVPMGMGVAPQNERVTIIGSLSQSKSSRETTHHSLTHDLKSGLIYYASADSSDIAKLSANYQPSAVSNAIVELNQIYKEQQWRGETPVAVNLTLKTEQLRVKQLQADLFGLGAIPIFANGEWHDGAMLTTNNVVVPENVRNVLLSLNWYERNENPLHLAVYGPNAIKEAMARNVSSCILRLHSIGYRVQFDRRFNLWRITDKFESDEQDNLQNSEPQE